MVDLKHINGYGECLLDSVWRKLIQIFSLSISDFHPDTWNPAWSVGTILTGLLSFMVEESSTYGSMEASSVVRRRLARNSAAENLKNETFVELFPGLVKEIKESAAKLRLERDQKEATAETNPKPSNETQNNREVQVENQNTDNNLAGNFAFFALVLAFGLLAGWVWVKMKNQINFW